MQDTEAHRNIVTPPLKVIETMDRGNQEYVVDQGVYYPVATNYYGYYCTGLESPSEWDDQQKFFGFGGPDPHYTGMQVDNLPYVYYTPNYGYSHSPYNPYNPYVPGAILGVDGSVVGEQQYYAASGYENYASSPAYYPLALQSRKDSNSNSALDPRLSNSRASSAIRLDGSGLKHPPSAPATKNYPKHSFGNVRSEHTNRAGNQTHSLPKRSDAVVSKQPVAHRDSTSSGAPHSTPGLVSQGKDVSASTRASNQFSLERALSLHTPYKVSVSVANGSSNFEVIGVRPQSRYGEFLSNGKASPDFLREQKCGPRINKDKNQWTSTISVKSYRTEAASCNAGEEITIYVDQYNKEDFPVNYTDAKFFVIKSYSEDDVHKSIKYGVWSSTSSGNKRLDDAYEDAQRIACGKPNGCPIFLFFSVNASGQFCGVAEMTGPVDFHKDMDFWQHDKWHGSFPVKWHMIKDVPNNNFRHIILENNENRPVTSSRDTQDIRYEQGMEMLHIFKNYSMRASIFDDFLYYEDRQKIMMEGKARYLRRNYNTSFYAPASVPPDHLNALVEHSPSVDTNSVHCNDADSSVNVAGSTIKHVVSKPDDHSSRREVAGEPDDSTSVLKIDSLTIDEKPSEEAKSVATVTVVGAEAVDVPMKSMPMKVNGLTGASSGTLKVGTIPIHLEGVKFDKSGRSNAGRSLL